MCVWVQLALGDGGDASFRGLLIAGKTDEVSLATVHVAQVAVEVEEPYGVIDRLRQIYGALDDVQLAPQVIVAPVDVGEQVERLELLLCLAGGTEDGKALFQPFPVGHCSIDGIDLCQRADEKIGSRGFIGDGMVGKGVLCHADEQQFGIVFEDEHLVIEGGIVLERTSVTPDSHEEECDQQGEREKSLFHGARFRSFCHKRNQKSRDWQGTGC